MGFFQVFICLLSLFQPIHLNDLENIKVKGEYENEEYRFIYGSIVNDNTDGILVVQDLYSNEEVIRIEYDDLGFEIFTYIADIGDGEVIVVCEKYFLSFNFEIPLFKHVLLMKYNIEGEKISQIVLDEKPISYCNHNNYLILTYFNNRAEKLNNDMEYIEEIILEDEYIDEFHAQYQGKAFINELEVESIDIQYPGNYDITIVDNQYSFSYSIIVHPLVIINGQEFSEAYTGTITVISKGIIEINEDAYESGTIISNPGYYRLVVHGANNYIFQQDITLLPFITYSLKGSTYDFIDGQTVHDSITIYSNGVTVLLNDKVYNSELISETGNYSLTIYGLNGMEYYLSFSILPKVTGVENSGIYDNIDFYVFGDATLNGETILGETHLENPGSYQLDLLLDGSVYKSYSFTIRGELSQAPEDELSGFNYNYIFYFLIALGAVLILRKK